MIEAGSIFDNMVKESREQKLNWDDVYPPLAAAMGDGNILDPNSLLRHYSLKAIIKDALYADNLIFSYDDASTLTKDVVACTLILNAFSFKIHEAFSNLPSQLLEIEDIVRGLGGHLQIHPSMAKFVTGQREGDMGQHHVSSPDEVTNSSPVPNDTSPETSESTPICSSTSITLPLKNSLIFQNEFVAHFNPPAMLDIFGLRVYISEPPNYHEMGGRGTGETPCSTNILDFEISCERLGNLAEVKLDKPSKRLIAQLLGLSYEPSAFCLIALKSHVKIALHLTSCLSRILKDYKKHLISLLTYMEPGLAGSDRLASDNNFTLGAEFTAIMKLGGNSLAERVRLLRANYPRAGWDVNLLDLNTQVQESNLFPSEMKRCFHVATDMILEHLNEFLSSAKRYKYLRYPLRYSGDCKCAVSMENIEKYIIALADGSPSKEPKFSASKSSLTAHSGGTDLSFLYGFMSTAI